MKRDQIGGNEGKFLDRKIPRNIHLEIEREAGGRLTVKSAGVVGHVTEHFGGKLS